MYKRGRRRTLGSRGQPAAGEYLARKGNKIPWTAERSKPSLFFFKIAKIKEGEKQIGELDTEES